MKARRHGFVGILFMLAILLIGIFAPYSLGQKTADAITDLTGDTTITINSIKNSASITIDPSRTGVFATTSGSSDIAFSVATSNYTGYELSVRSSKTTLDKDVYSFLSLSSSVTAEQFANAGNTPLNNRWGFKPNYYNSTENNKYYGASTSSILLDRTTASNSTAKNYTISLGARADASIPSGTYINENFIVEAVANTIPSSILTVNYATGITSITIGGQVISNGGTVRLIQDVPYAITVTTSSSYTFSGWTASSGTIASASTASTTYTISATDAAIMANATFSGPNIQNLANSSCTTTPSLAKDTRDGHIYTIQRLLDGNCWMMENLDLGRTSLSVNLTSSNTNLSTTIAASTFNSWKKTVGTQTYATGELIPVNGSDSTTGTPYGTLYNYYAASAGTISGSSNSNNASYDICPAGWRLPTGGSSGEQQSLYAKYNSPALLRAPIASGGAAFALAGLFGANSPFNQGTSGGGYYWSSTMSDNSTMYILYLGAANVIPSDFYMRVNGLAIRCILKKPTHTLTVTYGSNVSNVKVNGQNVSNGGTISLEEGVAVPITMSPATSFNFSGWSATSGTIGSSNTQTTTYKIGSSNATLTANATFNGPNMQNLTGTSCTTTATQAIDTRDNHVYSIKRMNDGVCWMVENLQLGATNISVNLTSSNSNLSTTITASTFNGWKKTSGSSTYTDGEFIPVSGNDSVNGSPYGVLYNFYAASGGTITGSTNANSSSYDICPAGWRLPSATRNTGEIPNFVNNYSTNTVLHQSIASGGAGMTLSGTFTSSTPSSLDWLSSYWSSSPGDTGCFSRNGKMLGLQFTSNDSTVYNDACIDRGSGNLIRCVLDESKISNLTYLQDFATLSNAGRNGVFASMAQGTQYQLRDSRDNKYYYIAKFADGNVWMTQNLDLDLSTSTTLTPANTDIPANWTPSSTTYTNTTWNFTTTTPQSYNPGNRYWNGNTHSGGGSSTSYISTSGTPQYHLGNYYNWTAAVALNNSSSYTTSGTIVDQSICPAGWTLPRGGYGPSTYYALGLQYSGNTLWLSPIYFALSGTWSGSYDWVGYTGAYWATGPKSADRAFYVDFASDGSRNFGTGGYDRDMGLPIRCIARPVAAYITQ